MADVTFYVTGFGPFRDAKENPTTTLAEKLVDYLRHAEQTDSDRPKLSSSTTTLIIPTAAEDARHHVHRLRSQVSHMTEPVVILHMGVNYRGLVFQLERCAYNNANFRFEDERGHQPRQECIIECPLDTKLSTRLNVDDLLTALNDERAVGSTDPGRFVCNYTYCYSLDRLQCHQDVENGPGNVWCLFLHVPPFQEVGEEEQLAFVAKLMEAIYKQVSASSYQATSR